MHLLRIVICIICISYSLQNCPIQNRIGIYPFTNNINQLAFSPNQKLLVAFVQNDSSFYIYHGVTFAPISTIKLPQGDSATSIEFFSDNSYLLVGTNLGKILSYKVNQYVIDPNYGSIEQNDKKNKITLIQIGSKGTIATINTNSDILFYKLNSQDKTFSLINSTTFSQTVNINSITFTQDESNLIVGYYKSNTQGIFGYVQMSTLKSNLINQQQTSSVSILNKYIMQVTYGEILFYDSVLNNIPKFKINYNNSCGYGKVQQTFVSDSFKQINLKFDLSLCHLHLLNINNDLSECQLCGKFNLDGSAITVSAISAAKLFQFNFTDLRFAYYSGCPKQKQYFVSQTDQCKDCQQLCVRCLNDANECYSCVDTAYLQKTTCILCSDKINYCTKCQSEKKCIQCQDGYLIDDKGQCSPCSSAIKGCLTCKDSKQCTLCDSIQNYIVNPDTKDCKCLDRYYLDQAKNCLSCTVINGCITCKNQNECLTCQQSNNFKQIAVDGKCACKDTYFLNNSVCSLCTVKIQFCELCSQNGQSCTTCQADIHRILNQNNTLCKCQDFYFEDNAKVCQLCDQFKKCISCQNQNECLKCNEKDNWILSNNKCICKPGYYQKLNSCIQCQVVGCNQCQGQNQCQKCNQSQGFLPTPQKQPTVQCLCQQHHYKDDKNLQCPLCSQAITGCIDCSSNQNCTKCNTQGHFIQTKSNLCHCVETYYLQVKQCIQCRKSIPYCKLCNSKTECTKCLDTFVLLKDQTKSSCVCLTNHHIKDNMCVEDDGGYPIFYIIPIIIGSILILVVIGFFIVKFIKSRRSRLIQETLLDQEEEIQVDQNQNTNQNRRQQL